VTKELFSFWRKNAFVPIYLRQTANELTGEHTCVMIRPINLSEGTVQLSIKPSTAGDSIEDASWVSSYFLDFKKRLINLFGYEFRNLPCSLAFQFIGEKN
jgi:N-acetyltransferase 10